jgi:hypothetical protein
MAAPLEDEEDKFVKVELYIVSLEFYEEIASPDIEDVVSPLAIVTLDEENVDDEMLMN